MLTITEFTPLASLLGGVLIGLAAVLLMAFEGRVAGISSIAVRMLPPWLDGAVPGRVAFIAGLVAAPLVWMAATGALPVATFALPLPLLLVAGLLVGFGSVWGGGCTSGHGVCGLSRLSRRSMVAVPVFMAAAMATVFVTRHLL